MTYNIGTKVWHKGDEVTIISDPYVVHGGLFQDVTTEAGKIVTIATPKQQQTTVEQHRKEWNEQQAQFRKLHTKPLNI